MFSKKANLTKRSEDMRKSASKVVDPKRDTPTRAKHLRLFLDNAELHEIIPFFEAYYSHIFYIVYDAFITAEINLRQKSAHKAQREELEAVLYLFEKILIYLPEHLGRKWQYHSVGRLMSKLLHPGNSWKLLKREAMRLFILWYQILGDAAGEPLHAMFATLVPSFPSPYQGMGLTALAAMTPDTTQDGPINPAEICPLIPPQSGERWRSQDTDLTRIFLDVLLELIVSQVTLIEWKEAKVDRQRRCLSFLFEKFKTFYMPHIFPDFSWSMSLYRPSLELPEVRKFRPAFVDAGDGTKRVDPMLSCRVVVIKWVAQYTHLTASAAVSASNGSLGQEQGGEPMSPAASINSEKDMSSLNQSLMLSPYEQSTQNSPEGNLVRDILYGSRENVDFVHEVYRQAFLLSFSHSPAIKKVITVYKDWIQMNVSELPPFLLEPVCVDRDRQEFMNALAGKYADNTDGLRFDKEKLSYLEAIQREHLAVRAGLQNVLQIFVTNAANVFLLEVSSEFPILLEEQVEMCKRVLNIYRYMVMNVKMEARTWEQLLFILLQITQLTLPEAPPRRREDTLGGRLAQAIFQTLIVTWIKANLYVVVSNELWDQFLEVLSSLTLWEELVREWAKTMETLTRVLARQVYHLDLNDLPLDRLSERAVKKRRGRQGAHEAKSSSKLSTSSDTQAAAGADLNNSSGDQSGFAARGERHPRLRGDSESDCKASPKTDDPSRRGKSNRHLSSHHHPGLNRSLSEGDILTKGYLAQREQQQKRATELTRQRRLSRRYKSADSLHNFSSRLSDSEGTGSRSSSPAPSSGIECTSMKDSPIQLDHDAISEGGISDNLTTTSSQGGALSGHSYMHSTIGGGSVSGASTGGSASEPRSVMSGGAIKGWLPDVAVVLWRRMLGALGNINLIADTVIHQQIYKYLIELFEILVKIRTNQGVSLDNLSTPSPPDYVPPFTIFAPWCFRALNLPEAYHRGRLYALRLLCLLTCRPHDSPLPKTHLVQFCKVLHEGLTGPRMDVTNTLVKFTGPRFFSLMLPGYTAFILDFLYAANGIISTSELKGVPRTEATSIVGALLAFPGILGDVPVLLPNAGELQLISSSDIKDQIVGVLLKSGKKEPAGLARCISLSSLGIFVYSELVHGTFHPKMKEAIQVLLTALRFNNKAVAQIASDMLLLLADRVTNFLEFYPEIPRKIIEVLARTLTHLCPQGESMNEDEKRLLLSLLLCLGEWCMRVPSAILTQSNNDDGRPLLQQVFSALMFVCDPTATPAAASSSSTLNNLDPQANQPNQPRSPSKMLSPAVMVADFDPNIHVDNTKEGYQSTNSSPLKGKLQGEHVESNNTEVLNGPAKLQSGSALSPRSSSPENDSLFPVRLAARGLLSHLLNNLFHFPMGVGAASLSSMVSEYDDVLALAAEELSVEIFQQPNIQFFILNDTTLVSFVELPALDTSAVVSAAKSQVRLILRDISGKFSWDCSAVYGPSVLLSNCQDDLGAALCPDVAATGAKVALSLSTRQAVRRRREDVLPVHENTADDMDNLDDLLQYISHTSPECLEAFDRPLNSVPASSFLSETVEKDVIGGVLSERNCESDSAQRAAFAGASRGQRLAAPKADEASDKVFQQCRRLFNQLGLASWESRASVHLVKKSERFLRELKNLDSKRCREAHKIAIVYVAEGQEDKQSILSNASGSPAFEQFVAGLAWEVELETHAGFSGGLQQRSRATGETAPYFATSFVEVMFHVSTRMPSSSEESLLQKTRHIGNDEVHVVWSEHWRDYRRDILPTEFCDVLIVIYPLRNNLFRIQISRKPEVPYFGPLFNEMIVDGRVLPGLVRATAVNASRAKRSMLTYYQTHVEERFRALETIIRDQKEKSTFEDFVTQVLSPVQLSNLFQYNASSSSRPVSLVASSSLGSSHLASALLDNGGSALLNHVPEMRPRTRTEVASSTQQLPSPTSNNAYLSTLNNNYENNHFADDLSSSPKQQQQHKKLSFKTSTSIMPSKRPLSIREEPGLPGETSPPPVPTRKR